MLSVLIRTALQRRFSGAPTTWAAARQNQQNDLCAQRRLRSDLSVFAVRMKKPWVLSIVLSAQWRLWSDCSDAIYHFADFVVLRLICRGDSNEYSQHTSLFFENWLELWSVQIPPSGCSKTSFRQYLNIRKASLTGCWIIMDIWLKI